MSKSTEEGYHLRGQRGQFKESVNCFLCLKLVRSPHPSPTSPPGCDGSTLPKKEVIDKKTLQALFRYLNVDGKDDLQKEVSSNEGKAGDKKETVDRMPDASLLLCKGCSLVTGELTKLVEQLIHTKIWINHWMRQLVDILSRSTTGPGPKSRKKKRLSGDSLTSLLRAETKKKCMYKLEKTDFPRVFLERHDDNSSGFGESGKESNILIPPDLIKEEHEEEEENGNDNLMEEMKQAQAHHESIDDIHVEPVVQVKQENFTLTPTSRIRVIMACPYCDETVTSNSGLNRHTAAFHPEQFLSSVKSAELSEQQFKSICQNLLSKLCQVKIIDKKIGCPYCPVTSGNRVYLKAHLIHGHQPILLRKLELLQNGIEETDRPEDVSTDTPSLQLQPKSLTNLISQPQRPRKNFYCRYCTKVCITQWSLKRHVLLSHRSSSSTSMPSIAKNIPTTKTVKNSCEHCGEKISTCYLKKHQEKCLASLKELESPSGPSTNQLPIQPHLAERKLKARKDIMAMYGM